MKKLMIIAGGTGGHIFPALTVADHCYAQGVSIYWLGSSGGMEEHLVGKQYHLETVEISGLRGQSKAALLRAPWRLLKALWQSMRILRRVKPDVVLGMGGFVSGPGGVAAWLLRIPLVIHEQNSVAGLTNRWLARLAKATLQAFPDVFPASVMAKQVGNPVRQDIAAIPPPSERFRFSRGPFRVLIIGGSRGASAINQLVCQVFHEWPSDTMPLIWHQTGQADGEKVEALYRDSVPLAVVEPFIEDMASAYAWADIVIARAGALTVAELAAMGAASILIPYPHAVDDHQYKNAQWLAREGAAIIFRQEAVTADDLRVMLMELSTQPQRVCEMADAAHCLGTTASGAQIIATCENIVRKHQGSSYAAVD